MKLNKQYMSGAIICKSLYGATRQYSDWLATGLRLKVFESEDPSLALNDYDYLVIGTSVYFGKMLLKDWLAKNKRALTGKPVFLFVVCATPNSEPNKQHQIVEQNVPAGLVSKQNIYFLPGRVSREQLSWKHSLILWIGAHMEKDPRKKAAMSGDIDGVEPAQLAGILDGVKSFLTSSAPAQTSPA